MPDLLDPAKDLLVDLAQAAIECHGGRLCTLTKAPGIAANYAKNSFIDTLANSVAESLLSTLSSMGSYWMSVRVPIERGDGQALTFAIDHTRELGVAIFMASVLIAGIQIIWHRRGEPARELMRSALVAIFFVTAGVTVGRALVNASEALTSWIITEGFGPGSQTGSGLAMKMQMFATNAFTGFQLASSGAIFFIIIGIITLIACLFQIIFLYIRAALIALMLAALPLAAAATNTSWGKMWLQKLLGFFAAFVLYKPVGAMVYVLGFKMIDGMDLRSGDAAAASMQGIITGSVLIGLSTAMLPILIGFFAPMAGGMAAGSVAGAVGMGAGFIAASGAKNVAYGGGVGDTQGQAPTGAASGSLSVEHSGSTPTTGGSQGSVGAGEAGASSMGSTASAAGSAAAGATGVGTAVVVGSQITQAVSNAVDEAVSQAADGPEGAANSVEA